MRGSSVSISLNCTFALFMATYQTVTVHFLVLLFLLIKLSSSYMYTISVDGFLCAGLPQRNYSFIAIRIWLLYVVTCSDVLVV